MSCSPTSRTRTGPSLAQAPPKTAWLAPSTGASGRPSACLGPTRQISSLCCWLRTRHPLLRFLGQYGALPPPATRAVTASGWGCWRERTCATSHACDQASGNRSGAHADGAPAGVIALTDFAGIWHGRYGCAHLKLTVAFDRGFLGSTAGFTPHQRDMGTRHRVLLVDNSE